MKTITAEEFKTNFQDTIEKVSVGVNHELFVYGIGTVYLTKTRPVKDIEEIEDSELGLNDTEPKTTYRFSIPSLQGSPVEREDFIKRAILRDNFGLLDNCIEWVEITFKKPLLITTHGYYCNAIVGVTEKGFLFDEGINLGNYGYNQTFVPFGMVETVEFRYAT